MACIYKAYELISQYHGKNIKRTRKEQNVKNKGADGEQIENILGLSKNSKSVPDFKNGELKTISLKILKTTGKYSPKETCAISMFNEEKCLKILQRQNIIRK